VADATAELSCREFTEVVTDFREGVLDRLRVLAVERHLADCVGCRTYLEQMDATVRALRGLAGEGARGDGARSAALEAFRGWARRREPPQG